MDERPEEPEAPVKIVIDTNAIFGDWKLETPHSRLPIAASAAREVEVVVPEVVVLEAAGMYGRQLQEGARAHEKTRRTLGRLGVALDPADIDIAASTTD